MQDQGIEENISGEEPYVFCCEEGFHDQLNAALQDSLARAVFNNLCCANPRPWLLWSLCCFVNRPQTFL